MLSFDLISTKMPFVGTKMPFGRRQKPIEWSEKHRGGLWKTTLRCFFYLLQVLLALSNTT